MPALIDLTGRTFGRLTVIRRTEDHRCPGGERIPRWYCKCECGSRVQALGGNLRGGRATHCGCVQHNWKGDDVSYDGAHRRVYRTRGRAALYQCIDCDRDADEWSYNHGDPNELIQVVERRGKSASRRYSGSPDFYSPRCRTCHAKFDAERE